MIDPAGRVSSTTTPNETINFAYNAITGSLSGASISTGKTIAYGYNGPLPTLLNLVRRDDRKREPNIRQ